MIQSKRHNLAALILIIGLTVGVTTWAVADDLWTGTQEGTSQSDVPSQARAECLTTALEAGAQAAIAQVIGAARTEKNQAVIKSKVFPESSKYVQFYKATEPVLKDGKTSLNVTMKISMSALREILDRAGLLIQDDDVYTILPAIKIQERKRGSQRSYSWWKEDDQHATSVIKDQFRPLILGWLSQEAKGYKIFDPTGGRLYPLVADQFKHDTLSTEEALLMAKDFKASLVLTGDITVVGGDRPQKTRAMARITGYNVSNGRQVVEFAKNYDVNLIKPNHDVALQQVMRVAFGDLARVIYAQLQDAYKRGDFGSQSVRLMVRGDLNYLDLENVKKELQDRIPEIRSLRERLLQRGAMTLEGDLVGSVGQMVKKIESSKFENFEVSVQNVTPKQVDLNWSKISKRRSNE